MPLNDSQFEKALEFIQFKLEELGLDRSDIRVMLRWILDKVVDSNLSDLRNMSAINQYLLDKRAAHLRATKATLEAEIAAIDDELN